MKLVLEVEVNAPVHQDEETEREILLAIRDALVQVVALADLSVETHASSHIKEA